MNRTARILAHGVLAACASFASGAEAEPLRLRGDALAEARSPTGLVVLQGEDKGRTLGVEGLVWAGARNDPAPSGVDASGDVLVLALHARDRRGRYEGRIGRFVFASGAIRPLHVDGAWGIVRAPWGGTFEAVAGTPVVPRLAGTTGPSPETDASDRHVHEWVAGARAAQAIGTSATIGASYYQRRDRMEVADEEVGADFAAAAGEHVDLAARTAYDVTSPGLADALLSAAWRASDGGLRLEAFGAHRSPSRLLPATSLFSVLGDFPSEDAGANLLWRAAPRLDLRATAMAQIVGATLGGNGWVRALLRLDDRGEGSLGLEVRRQDVSSAKWTGVRGIASLPLARAWRYSTELELAVPDAPRGRGVVWPWGLVALGWQPGRGWEVAGAVEASSSPEHRYETDALLRVAKTWEPSR